MRGESTHSTSAPVASRSGIGVVRLACTAASLRSVPRKSIPCRFALPPIKASDNRPYTDQQRLCQMPIHISVCSW